MSRQAWARVLFGVGAVLIGAGVLGLVLDDGTTVDDGTPSPTSSPSTTQQSVPPSTTGSTPVPSTVTSTTVTSTTVTSTTVASTVAPEPTPEAETAKEFLAVLEGALDSGDTATLLDRLNPATLDRYGVDQCQDYIESVAGTGLDAVMLDVRDLTTWDYTTDGVTTTLSDVVAVDLERTVNGQVVPQTTHWKLVDGRVTWFTDCGVPL